jgi:hypothetical protein
MSDIIPEIAQFEKCDENHSAQRQVSESEKISAIKLKVFQKLI